MTANRASASTSTAADIAGVSIFRMAIFLMFLMSTCAIPGEDVPPPLLEDFRGRYPDMQTILRVSAEMGSTTALTHAVRSGGMAFISRRAVVDTVAHGFLKIIAVTGHLFPRVFYVVTDKSAPFRPSGKAFRDFLLRQKV